MGQVAQPGGQGYRRSKNPREMPNSRRESRGLKLAHPLEILSISLQYSSGARSLLMTL